MTNLETNPFPDVVHIPKNRKHKWNNHVRNQEGVRLGDWVADALDRAVECDGREARLEKERDEAIEIARIAIELLK